MKKPEPPPGPLAPGDYPAFLEQVNRLYADRNAQKILGDAERGHPSWEKFKYRVAGTGLDAAMLWRMVQVQRRADARPIHLNTDSNFQFSYNLTSTMQETLHLLDLKLGGTIGSGTTFPEGTRDQILVSSLMEEAIASSILEGAATTREVAKRMLREGRSPKDRSERMVVNNYRTMQKLVGWPKEPVTVERLLELHRTVTDGTLHDPHHEGRIRTDDDVYVEDENGEPVYFPPSHQGLPELLQALCTFANRKEEEPFMHPVVKGITLHFLIGYIHPFTDGNGRTARALFYWHLLRSGYWLVEFLAISKIILRAPAQYGRAYLHTEQDGTDLTYFLDFNLRSLRLAMEDLDQYLLRKMQERKGMFTLVRNTETNKRQADLVALWLREPETMLTIAEVKTRFNVTYQTARTDLMGLVELKLADQKKSGRKLVFFRSADFDSVLRQLRRPPQ